MRIAVLLLANLCLFGQVLCSKDASNGFGSKLQWKSPKQIKGFDWSSNKKPVMYLFNQPWCGACNNLKQDFQENEEDMLEISKNFILVNVGGDDNDAFGEDYQPDGGYIPRIMFADAQNTLKPELFNPARAEQYRYYYTSVEDIMESMQRALSVLGGDTPAHTEL
eukprot:jgi/Botrbrau1/9103/Bobra.0305s0010.1